MLFESSLISLALVKNVLMVSSLSSLSFSFMLPVFSLFRELINGLIVLQKLIFFLTQRISPNTIYGSVAALRLILATLLRIIR